MFLDLKFKKKSSVLESDKLICSRALYGIEVDQEKIAEAEITGEEGLTIWFEFFTNQSNVLVLSMQQYFLLNVFLHTHKK